MSIIDKVLQREEFIDDPPVLIDVGASERIHKKWKSISKHCVCIAFDADEREFGFIVKENSKFKKLYVYNCILSDKSGEVTDFYLTKSPYCSSLLEPNLNSLQHLAYSDSFKVEKIVRLKTVNLQFVLNELKINRVDWFKTDSQGIDLRLFKSLGGEIINKVLAVEFEPGIIDAYIGEDKLHSILSFIDSLGTFWMSELKIKGTARINSKTLATLYPNKILQKLVMYSLKESPCWGEITYLNSFNNSFSLREYLLGWVFATIQKQHGFAYNIAQEGLDLFKEKIFNDLLKYSGRQIRMNILKIKFLPAVFVKISKMF